MAARMCICGRSATFPMCDGTHVGDWSCAALTDRVRLLVLATHHLSTVGERLAHTLDGVSASAWPDGTQADRVVVLTDGTDLPQLSRWQRQVQAVEKVAIAVETSTALVRYALPGWSVREALAEHPRQRWAAVLRAVHPDAPEAPVVQLVPGFLSHAVADEPLVQGAVDALRREGASVFLCADSIEAGDAWRERIESALTHTDRMVFLVSQASVKSTYCAYELGFAMARGLQPRLISLDGTVPPPFVAHIQAADLVRTERRRPWMTRAELLLDALVEALSVRDPA